MELVDVICPDCKASLRIDISMPPGHCHYCGRLLRYNRDTMEIEPGEGEESDKILTQYEFLRRRQQFGAMKPRKKN